MNQKRSQPAFQRERNGKEKCMYFSFSLVYLVLLTLISSELVGSERTPPVMPEDNSRQEYLQKIILENPWIATAGLGGSMTALLGSEQKFLPEMLRHSNYLEYVQESQGDLSFEITRLVPKLVQTATLDPKVLTEIKSEIWKLLQPYEGTSLADAKLKIAESLDANLMKVADSDPRGILTGLINCLPADQRGPLFSNSDSQQVLQLLSEDPGINDESIKDNYRGASGDGRVLTRSLVLEQVRELFEAESQIFPLIRTLWYLWKTGEGQNQNISSDLKSDLDKEDESFFDLSSVADGDLFLQKFLSALVPDAKGILSHSTRKKIEKYLAKLTKKWRELDHVLTEITMPVAEPYLLVREAVPYIAVHRSVVTRDCGTVDDFPFPYSPLERSFFVFEGNRSLAYLGTTIISLGGVRTLLVHDLVGAINHNQIDDVLKALSNLTHQFKVEQISIATNGLVRTTLTQSDIQKNTFLDHELRNFFATKSRNAHGDRPQDMAQSKILPKQNLNDLKVSLLTETMEVVAKSVPQRPREQLIAALELVATIDPPDVLLAQIKMKKEDFKVIQRLVLNQDKLNLSEYWSKIEELLKEFEIKLSEKLLKKYGHHFATGHFTAPDLYATRDPKTDARTISLTLQVLKSGENHEFIYQKIGENPALFEKSIEFSSYAQTLPINVEAHLERAKSLLSSGVSWDVLAPSRERLLDFVQTTDVLLTVKTLEVWKNRFGYDDFPREFTSLLLEALRNDEHESDEPGLLAIRILKDIPNDDPITSESLRKSAKYDDNPEIALTAAAILQSHDLYPDVVALAIEAHANSLQMNQELRWLVERLQVRRLQVLDTCSENFRENKAEAGMRPFFGPGL